MRWSPLKPDAAIGELSDLLRQLDCVSAIRLYCGLAAGVRIYMTNRCRRQAMSHVSSDRNEVGGLLIGRAWADAGQGGRGAPPVVLAERAVASAEYRNSAVSLEMGTEIWNRVNAQAVGGSFVIGWYHSHPNLGAFFSGTDRRTQRAFFTQSYSIGWVIDPFRHEERVFCGADSDEYLRPIVALGDDVCFPQCHAASELPIAPR